MALKGPKGSEGHHTSLSMIEDFPARSARLSKGEKKDIKSSARRLFEREGPGAATAFLAGTRGYTNFRPDALIGKYLSRPVDYGDFRPIGSLAFQDLLGRKMNKSDFSQAVDYAKAMGVKDPSAFQSLLTQRIASSPEGQSRIKSEADIAWEQQYGNMQRDAAGNLKRGMVTFDPAQARQIADTLLGKA